MDYELEQQPIRCYRRVGQAVVCQEETQEAIVPDACPDILRIVDVQAQAFPSRWEGREGQAAVTGTIRATVLYQPEQGEGLHRMELTLPFTAVGEIPGMAADAVVEVCSRLRRADARILNPRKVLLRCDVVTELTALGKGEHTVYNGAARREEDHLCQRLQRLDYECISSAVQRIFPLSEEIRLTGTQPPTLLCSRGRAACVECRIIGSKLIFKGKLDVDLLLQGPEGGIERHTESFPFSQILEVKEAGEGGVCSVRLAVCELTCLQPPEDPFHLSVEAEVLAMGQVRERDCVTVLTDLYSTTHHTQLEEQTLTLYAPGEQTVVPQTLRELLETEGMVRSVCDSRFELGQLMNSREGENLTLTAQGRIVALCQDEGRQFYALEKEVAVPVRIPCPPGTQLTWDCIPSGELFAAPCAGGVEVRLGLEFQVLTAPAQTVTHVSRAAQGEPRDGDSQRPSVILRQPQGGETLWDLAKACGTTGERILQANELTSEELPPQRMLLIPSAR